MKLRPRQKGSENVLIKITYGTIASLCGLSRLTVRHYAGLHRFNSRDLDSIVRFVNYHRAKQGMKRLGE